MNMKILVGNGPSAQQYYGLCVDIVCNTSFLHFTTQHVVAIDDRAYHHITNNLKIPTGIRLWTRRNLGMPTSILDSGSASVALAKRLWPDDTYYAVGFDGILQPTEPDANTTNYSWPWHADHAKIQRKRQRHVDSMLNVHQGVVFVSDIQHEIFATISHQDFRKKRLHFR